MARHPNFTRGAFLPLHTGRWPKAEGVPLVGQPPATNSPHGAVRRPGSAAEKLLDEVPGPGPCGIDHRGGAHVEHARVGLHAGAMLADPVVEIEAAGAAARWPGNSGGRPTAPGELSLGGLVASPAWPDRENRWPAADVVPQPDPPGPSLFSAAKTSKAPLPRKKSSGRANGRMAAPLA